MLNNMRVAIRLAILAGTLIVLMLIIGIMGYLECGMRIAGWSLGGVGAINVKQAHQL
jgi:hypothetical protein